MVQEKPPYYSFDQIINKLDPHNKKAFRSFVRENQKLIETAQGSLSKHQAWKGGYIDHLTECANIFMLLCSALESTGRQLCTALSCGLLVILLHDTEKLWAYKKGSDGKLEYAEELKSKPARADLRNEIIMHYGFTLTPQMENAMLYIEGENEAYSKRKVMGELAALCHVADVLSARYWPNYPLENNEPWTCAKRSQK
jgi:hypothetical protein